MSYTTAFTQVPPSPVSTSGTVASFLRPPGHVERCEELASLGVPTAGYNMYSKHGGLIWNEARGIDAGYRWPQYSVHRGELQMMLFRAVRDRLGLQAIQTSARLTGYRNEPDGVVATFQNRAGAAPSTEVTRASVLIGADGIHSAVRAQMYPREGDALWSGRILWRATTRAVPYLDGATMVLSGYEATKFVSYPISVADPETGEATLNRIAQLTFDLTDGYNKEDYTRQAKVEDFLHAFEGWSFSWVDDLESMVRAADRIYEYPMVDRDPLPSWTDGNTTLLGDAAHVKMILTNRRAGPDHIMQIVEERCGGVFDDIEEVMSNDERTDFAAGYKKTAGFAIAELNASPDIIPPGATVA